MTETTIGFGTVLEMADQATPTQFELISEIFDVSPPGLSTARVNATSNQSPNRAPEFIPGLKEESQLGFSMNHIPGGVADALIRASDGKTNPMRLTFPNGAGVAFLGILASYEPDAPTEDRMVAAVSYTVSGDAIATPVQAPRNLIVPSIVGSPVEGGLLTLESGQFAGAIRLEYQWEVSNDGGAGSNFDVIAGATQAAFVPNATHVGEVLRATVTGYNGSFNTAVQTANTAVVA